MYEEGQKGKEKDKDVRQTVTIKYIKYLTSPRIHSNTSISQVFNDAFVNIGRMLDESCCQGTKKLIITKVSDILPKLLISGFGVVHRDSSDT